MLENGSFVIVNDEIYDIAESDFVIRRGTKTNFKGPFKNSVVNTK